MSNDFTRDREGFRFEFLGLKVNSTPDVLPPGKHPLAINIRGLTDHTIQTRPGLPLLFTAGTSAILNIRAYSALSTDNLPRFLAYDAAGAVWLDNGAQKGTLAVSSPSGASMIPFRPNASPTPWMYIANDADYQKLSSPAINTVTAQKVGIAEPQTAPDAALFGFGAVTFGTANPAPGWANAGTANAVTNGTRLSDTCGTVLNDPANANLQSIQVGAAVKYQRLMPLEIHTQTCVVQDVFPPLVGSITISAIRYFTGSTGRCIVVPANLAAGPGTQEQSIYLQNLLGTLRRGALIKIASEICYVWSITVGPDGTVAIETSTTGTHTTADALTGIPAIQVLGVVAVAANAIAAADVFYQITTGIGTQTVTPSTNPFTVGGGGFQPDDLISIGLKVDTLANLTEVKFLIDVSDGTFTSDFYYYTIRPSDITAAVANTDTQLSNIQTVTQRALIDEEVAIASGNQLQTSSSAQLYPGSSQWTQVVFPISALTRVGNDQTKSLQSVAKIQFLWNASGTINVATPELIVMGSFQPDVGDAGAPYLYRVRARASTTGVLGNPSPATRYGVNPRRAEVQLTLPSAGYDPQIDTWDIFRYGGSVTEWRFIGSTPSSNSTFNDNYDDAAAQAGEALDFDNFEPWPTIDVPLTGTASVVNGTVAVVFSASANILRYLPGTLVRLGAFNVYTLWTRPTSLGSNNYLLQFIESAGASTNTPVIIQEPILANQHLPYMWGPDADGTVFACGDPLRPGTVSFAKNYVPDSAPDKYNLEISPPSEPLLGGETLDGLSFVASSERWWALYPQPQDVRQRYSIVQQPLERGLVAPWGHCTDGKVIYWWAKDGIWSSADGSLTDADLRTLFPHDGVVGVDVTYAGNIVRAPDYSRVGTFRLAYVNYYLYATYQASNGQYYTLVCDLRKKAWSVDLPSPAATVYYHPEQQAGTVLTALTRYPELLAGTVNDAPAKVLVQQDLTNDAGGHISCFLATREWDGGDSRAPKGWGDIFLDCTPASNLAGFPGITAQPFSLGASVTASTNIPMSANRVRLPISTSFGGQAVSDFMGVYLQWNDDFTAQSTWTKVRIWSPSFVILPARAVAWFTAGSAFGNTGYMHVRQISLAYISTAPIVVAITAYDGQSPIPVTLPSSSGNYIKTTFPVSANKGMLFKFNIFSPSNSQFQIFSEDTEIFIGAWGREEPYQMLHNFGGSIVEASPV